jgi:hypothetical protein
VFRISKNLDIVYSAVRKILTENNIKTEAKSKRIDKRPYEEYHKIVDGVLYKKCTRHKEYFENEDEWLPCTNEYFYINKTNNIDGLHPECKRCGSRKAVEWKKEHREHVNEQNRIARIENKWNVREIMKRNGRRRIKNGAYREWCNSDSGKESSLRSRLKRQNKEHRITSQEWLDCKYYFNNACAYCGLSADQHFGTRRGITKIHDLHKEHVNHEGENDLSNCVPACQICNSEKHTFALDEWYNEDNPRYDENRYYRIKQWLNEDYKKYITGDYTKR